MLKIFIVCISAVLIFSTSVFALGGMQINHVGQTQAFTLWSQNAASQVCGQASTTAGNMGSVEQKLALTPSFGTKLTLNESSMLTQGASTSGSFGTLKVHQIGSITASQNQPLNNMGCFSLKTQGQSLDVNLQETAYKKGGSGSAEGAQGSVSTQGQTLISGKTNMTSTQTIGTAQMSNVTGTGWSDGTVINRVHVTANQSQMTN